MISMPEMARLLGVKRNTVYSILKNPQYKDEEENVMTIPDGVDAELLMKVLSNPEMTALLTSLAKTMK